MAASLGGDDPPRMSIGSRRTIGQTDRARELLPISSGTPRLGAYSRPFLFTSFEGRPISRAVSSTSRPAAARRLFACILAVVCGWVAYAVYGAASQSRALDARVSQLRSENTALQQQIDERRRQIQQAQTLAWLEEEARKLGYVAPGEKVFVLTPPGSSVPKGGGVDAKLPTYTGPPTPTPTPTPTAIATIAPTLVAPPVGPAPH